MGLALAQDLLSKASPRWRVVLADVNTSTYNSIASDLEPARHLFVHTDVANWTEQVVLFQKAYEWSNGRIDFFAANAGIADQEHMLQHSALDAEPEKPDLSCIEVDLLAVFYGLKLFVHSTRKTRRDLCSASTDSTAVPFNPKMVITASMAGQYPFFSSPQYAAAKHGCVGLVRTVAPALLKHENIALNCIMPGFVPTNTMPPGLLALWPCEHVTPVSTVLRAFNELVDENGLVEADGKSQGLDEVPKSGCAVECSVDELFYRNPVEYANASQKFVTDQSKEEGLTGRAVQKQFGAMQKQSMARLNGVLET